MNCLSVLKDFICEKTLHLYKTCDTWDSLRLGILF